MAGRPADRSRRRSSKQSRALLVEVLESRLVPSVASAQPDYMRIGGAGGSGGVTPHGSPGPTGYSPAQLKHAYGFDQVTFSNGTVTGDGSGESIAIVDAYDDPRLVSSTSASFSTSDLHKFDVAFGLPDPTFTKLDENGGTSYPAANAGWISEIALDVEWAHAIAPKAGIVLVEAASASFGDLLTAVQTAARQPGVVAVSMSWGGGEFSGESSYDSYFQASGVTYLVSSGDSGAPAEYPSASPFVVSVGGTTLHLDGSNNISSETGWADSGGGVSSQESKPSYQASITSTRRATPDVAYDADPNTGVPVYDTYNNSTSAPWSQFGGTSIAAPQWAGLIAVADQGRALNRLGSLTGSSQTLPMLYGFLGDFHDITVGTSVGRPNETAGRGYDLVTGVGTPIANKLIADLSGQPATPVATHFAVSASPSSITAGNSVTLTVTAEDASNNPVPTYTGTVHFTSSDGQAVLPGNFPFQGVTATATFTVTLKTAGSETITVTDTSSGISGSTPSPGVAVSPAGASQLLFLQQPQSGTINEPLSAVKVELLDAFGNVLTNDTTDTVQLALTNPGGATLNGTLTQPVSAGVATFGNLSVDTLGTYTLTATSAGLSLVSGGFTISAPVATKLVVTGPGGPATAGTPFQVTVTAEDNAGHVATGFSDLVQINTSTSGDVLPASAQLTNGVGTFTVTTFTVPTTAAHSDTVTATDAANSGIFGSVAVTVNPAAASQVVFVQQPSNTSVGAEISPAVTVRVLDAYSNVRNGDAVTLALSPASGNLGGTLTRTVSNGVATFGDLTVGLAGAYTLTASSGGVTSAPSNGFTITAPAVTQFAVTGPTSPVTAGTPFQITVTAEDAGKNPVPSYTGTVQFSSSDGQASLPGNFTFQGTTATATFTVTLYTVGTAGNDTASVSDTSQITVTGSATIAVNPAAASQLLFLQQPQNGTINETLSAVKVELLDAFNNVLTNDNTDAVQLALTNPGGATLNGTLSQPVSAGVATFANLSVDTLGSYTLTAGSTPTGGSASLSLVSGGFTISAPVATQLVVTGPGGSATAGTPFQVTVTAEDNAGHVATGFSDLVQITTFTTGDSLPPSALLTNGVGTFTVTTTVAGSDTVTAKDTANSGIQGSVAVPVIPAAASQVVFVQQPSNATAGAAISPAVTVKVVDAYNNIRNGDTVTLSLTGSPSGVTLGGTLTQTVSGSVATFNNLTVSTAGTYTLTATSGSLSLASGSFVISAASTGTVIEDFETSDMWNIVNGTSLTAVRSTAAAHDGTYGLDSRNGSDWYYRSDAAAQVQAGDTLSVWMKFTFTSSTRAYFAFGASSIGTLSLVAAPNTGQFIIQENWGYGFFNLAAVSQTYLSNHWYRLEVDWGTSGTIVGNLFDSNGTTLLRTVTAFTTDITSGGFGFRNIGYDTYWDTVTAVHGVNNFAVRPGSPAGGGLFQGGSLAPRESGTIPISSPAPVGRSPLEGIISTNPATLASALEYLYWEAGTHSVLGGWETLFQSFEGTE
jgi:subtilase family serine protease